MYKKEELEELAKGVFNDDKTSPSIYADADGTFRNSVQYAAMKEEEKKKFPFEFKNPNVKDQMEISDASTEEVESLKSQLDDAVKHSAQLQSNLDATNLEIDRLNGLKGVKASTDLQAQLDAANAEIKALKDKYETK